MKAGWVVRPLSEVTAKIGSGATPRGGKNAYKADGLSLIRSLNIHDLEFRYKNLAKIDDVQADALSNVIVEPNDVLLNITGASIARCSQVPDDVLPARVNQHVSILRPKPDLVDSQFLTFLLVSKEVKDNLLGIGDKAGATRQALTKAQLQNFPVTLPPLEEQQRIVAVLDQAFAGLARACAHAEANLQNARELFGSFLRKSAEDDAKSFGTITVSDIASEVTDGDHMPPPKAETGIPFITISNVNKDTRQIDFTETFKVPEIYYNALKEKRQPKIGDVLYTVTGSFGIPVPIETEQKFCFQRHIALIRPKPKIDSEWLYFMMMSPYVFDQADEGANGAAQRTVSLKLLRGLLLPNTPPELQPKLASSFRSRWDASQVIVNSYQTKLQDLGDLRQSLLQKAFAGELT